MAEAASGIDLAQRLVGVWVGTGKGEFPTIQPFEYREEVTFSRPNPAKPFLHYQQWTWSADGSKPMHSECGYLRVFPDNVVEFVVAQPTALAEIELGKMYLHDSGDGTLCIDTQAGQETKDGLNMVRGERNKDPKCFMVVRRFKLKDDVLSYNLLMATSTTPKLTHHLHADLKRKQ